MMRYVTLRNIMIASVFMLVSFILMEIHASRPVAEETIGPGGEPALLVECSKEGDCLRKLAKECLWGYRLLGTKGETEHGAIAIPVSEGSAIPVQTRTFHGTMLVRCR